MPVTGETCMHVSGFCASCWSQARGEGACEATGASETGMSVGL